MVGVVDFVFGPVHQGAVESCRFFEVLTVSQSAIHCAKEEPREFACSGLRMCDCSGCVRLQ